MPEIVGGCFLVVCNGGDACRTFCVMGTERDGEGGVGGFMLRMEI